MAKIWREPELQRHCDIADKVDIATRGKQLITDPRQQDALIREQNHQIELRIIEVPITNERIVQAIFEP